MTLGGLHMTTQDESALGTGVLGADALEADLLAANIARAMGASARRIVETLDDEQQPTDNFVHEQPTDDFVRAFEALVIERGGV